jgi:hypothetical protein
MAQGSRVIAELRAQHPLLVLERADDVDQSRLNLSLILSRTSCLDGMAL